MHINGVVKAKISGSVVTLGNMWFSGYVSPPVTPYRIGMSYYDASGKYYVKYSPWLNTTGLVNVLMGQFTGSWWSFSSVYKSQSVTATGSTCIPLDSGTIAIYIHKCNANECYNIWPSSSTSFADYADYMVYIRQYGTLIVDSDVWKQICPFMGALNGWLVEIQKSAVSPVLSSSCWWIDINGIVPGTKQCGTSSSNWLGRFMAIDISNAVNLT